MFKLLIVDDEESALSGLADYVDWEELGFELAGAVQTIAQAMEVIQAKKVDVLLSDIQLEGESGLDLIRSLGEANSEIRCVILSGHSDFEYARQALRCGTYDFLTKPVQFDSLKSTFSNLREQLLHDRMAWGEKQEYRELKRSNYFNNLAKEKIAYNYSAAEEMGIHGGSLIRLARIRLMGAGVQTILKEEDKKKVRACLETAFIHVYHDIFNNAVKEYSILVYDCEEQKLIEIMEQFVQNCGLEVYIGVSTEIKSISKLGRAYFEAGKALDYYLFKRNQKVISFSSIKDVLYTESVITEYLADQINEALIQKNIKNLEDILFNSLDALLKSRESAGIAYTFCIEFYLLIDRFLRNYLVGYTSGQTVGIIRQLVMRDTQKDICEYMKKYLISLKPLIQEANPYSGDVIAGMQSYIREHFGENITLQSLSDQFFLHPIYLSKLFKDKTGQNFIDYLTQIRYEMAGKLLVETDLKVYSISQMVGYESSKYFSKLFKDFSGKTPKEYREEKKRN